MPGTKEEDTLFVQRLIWAGMTEENRRLILQDPDAAKAAAESITRIGVLARRKTTRPKILIEFGPRHIEAANRVLTAARMKPSKTIVRILGVLILLEQTIPRDEITPGLVGEFLGVSRQGIHHAMLSYSLDQEKLLALISKHRSVI